jgi:lipopolysaccharide biosynthesis regulator YciM
MLTQVIEAQDGLDEAQQYLQQQLERNPSLEGLHTLLSLGELTNATLVPLVHSITEHLLQHERRYLCQHCGFSGKAMHWHCPGCQQWSTIRPTEFHSSTLEHASET